MVDIGKLWYAMVEEEVAFVKTQPRKSGSFMITIPAEAVRKLGIKKEDRRNIKVLVDEGKKRLIYQF